MFVIHHEPVLSVRILDVVTGVDKLTNLTGWPIYITENLILTRRPQGFEILDLLDNSMTPVQRAEDIPGVKHSPETSALLDADELNIDLALSPFHAAEKVYLRDDIAVALAWDFKNHPDQNFVIGPNLHTPSGLGNLLHSRGISFESESLRSHCGSDGCISQSGLLRDRGYAIFTTLDNKLMVNGVGTEQRPFYSQSWLYEDSGVLLYLGPQFLIDIGIGGFGNVPQPILKLKVPKEYLLPELQQLEDARQIKEQTAKNRALIIFWSVVGSVLAASLLVFRGRRRYHEKA